MTENKATTIWIKQKTKELLDKAGKKGETYEDIIMRLLRSETKSINLKTDGVTFYRQGVEARPWFISTPYHRAFEIFGRETSFTYFIGKRNRSYWSHDVAKEKAWNLLKQHLKDGKFLKESIDKWEKLVKGQTIVEKKIDSQKNNPDKLMEEYRKHIFETWKIGIFIELFDPCSEEILMQLLNRYDKNNLTIKELKVLCSPEMLTSIQKEMLELYTIAEKKDYKKLEQHAKRWFWIKNTWGDTKILDENFFKENIMRLEEEGIDFSAEIKKIEKYLEDARRDKKRIYNKYPKLNIKIKRAIEFFEMMTEWRERRKKCALITNHYLGILAGRISKSIGVDKELLMFAMPSEIKLPLDDEYIEELEKRKEFCLYYTDEEGDKIITGENAKEIVKRVSQKDEKQNDRLYGNVANPGKVEGFAKIIFTTDDLHKMEKGDILVAPCTRPEYVTAMKIAKAIITDEGGITSHAAIVSRELGVPCIVGLQTATDVIKDGDLINVNANHGIVSVLKRK